MGKLQLMLHGTTLNNSSEIQKEGTLMFHQMANFVSILMIFCNLNLPEPYDLHILGWIEKEDFLHRFRKYSSWVWPNDSIDKRLNQKWSQLTVNDINLMNKLGIDAQRSADDSMPAGLLKTHGKGGGACCYVFPNVPRRGGVNETNLYVLPQDLKPMETLVP